MSKFLPDTFMTNNDSPEEFLVINGLKLRVNPTDIQILQNKNPEIVGMLRASKTYAFASRFVKGKVQIYLAFDIENTVDVVNLISLCTYMDFYPFMFVKSEKLKRYTNHTYSDIFDYQIYGVHSYSLETNADAQNVYFLTMELEFFDSTPMAHKLYFFDIETKETPKLTPTNGLPSTEINTYTTVKSNPNDSDLFNGYFEDEIQRRINSFIEFQATKGFDYVGLQFPNFFDQDRATDAIKNDLKTEKFVNTVLKDSDSILDANVHDDPTEARTIYVTWGDTFNPVKDTKEPKLNVSNNMIQNICITKRNYIASQSMTGYPYPVLQYMGKGQTDILISMSYASTKNEDISALTQIRAGFSGMDANFISRKQNAVFNVMKIDSLISIAAPIFGAITIGDKIVASANEQGKESYELYLLEADNRELLKRRQFHDSGSNAGVDFDVEVKAFTKAIQLLDTGVANAPVLQTNTHIKTPRGISDADLKLLQDLEKKYNLPNGLLYGLMMAESGGNKFAVSPAGAVGAFQFLPSTAHKDYGINPYDFDAAADAAGQYLSKSLAQFDNNLPLAIASYNTGRGNVSKYGERVLTSSWAGGETLQHNLNTIKFMTQAQANNYAKLTTTTVNKIINSVSSVFDTDNSNVKSIVASMGSSVDDLIKDPAAKNLSNYDKAKYYLPNLNQIYTTRDDIKGSLKNAMDIAYANLYKAQFDNNKIALGAIESVDPVKGNLVTQDDDKFRDQAIPDLKFDERLSLATLQKYKITDLRQVPPFFFLASKPYFNFKQVSTVFDVVTNLYADPKARTNIINEERKLILDSVIPAEAKSDLRAGDLIDDSSTFDIPLAKGMNTGDNRTQMSETATINQTNIFNQPKDTFDPIDLGDIVTHQKLSVSSYFSQGINLAFPTIKVYIVDGDETLVQSRIQEEPHTYYELDGIIDANFVTNNDDSPVDVLTLTLSNPNSVYTDRHVLLDKFRIKKNEALINTQAGKQIILNNLYVRPGIRIHVRAGYGNDTNALEPIFNGLITEVGGEDVIQVIAEGFGRELVTFRHGEDPKVTDSFFLSARTENIVANALNAGEIEHFGLMSFLKDKDPESRRLFTGKLDGVFDLFKHNDLFTNVWINAIEELKNDTFNSSAFALGSPQLPGTGNNDIETNILSSAVEAINPFAGITNIFPSIKRIVTGNGYPAFFKYPIFKVTPWDMLKEMEFRNPGILSKPMLYDDRMTYFYGLKEQLYIFKSLNNRLFQDQSSLLTSIIDVAGNVASFLDPFNGLGSFLGSTDTNSSSKLYKSIRASRFKPVCNMHIANTEHNIISNKIRATDDFATVVTVQYYDSDIGEIRDYSYKTIDIKVDDNLRPMAHRQTEMGMPGIQGKALASRYGSTKIRRETEKMYDGQLTILGNPKIKANDYISISDSFRKMYGVVKVRECIHKWSLDEGYVTVITPGLIAETHYLEYNLSQLFPVLYSGCYLLSEVNSAIAKKASLSNGYFLDSKSLNDIQQKLDEQATPSFMNEVVEKAAPFVSGLLGADLTSRLLSKIISSAGSKIGLGSELPTLGEGLLATGARLINNTTRVAASAAEFLSTEAFEGALVTIIPRLAFEAAAGLVGFLTVNAVGFAALGGVIAYFLISSLVSHDLEVREPLRIYPLRQNGIPYVSGIYGYKEQGVIQSWKENLVEFGSDFKIVTSGLIDAISRD